MYKHIQITGFSDEINPAIDEQFALLNELGISYFDPRGVDGTNISDLTDEQADVLVEKMKKANIKVACLGSPIGKIEITDPIEPHLEKLKRTIEIAKKIDTKYIRMFSFFMPKGEDPAKYRDEVMRRLQLMVDIAEAEGVVLLHENEKGIYGDTASRCKDIFDTIKSPAFSGVFDPANFIQCGQEVYPAAIEMLKPYITYMHIKDCTAEGQIVPAGMGVGQIDKVFEVLLAEGYEGFACLEPHLGKFEGLAALEQDDTMLKLEASDGKKFVLAYNSLKKILDKVGA